MQENLSSQKNNIIIAVVALVFILGGVYFGYNLVQNNAVTSAVSVDSSLFNPNVKAYYVAKDKINFADLSFMKKPFYSQLTDYTVEIPSVKPTGRPNPFVPYVTP